MTGHTLYKRGPPSAKGHSVTLSRARSHHSIFQLAYIIYWVFPWNLAEMF